MIDTRIVDFAEKHRIAVISTLVADGAPHSATIHYASTRPLEFFFVTERTTRKLSAIIKSPAQSGPASVVIGFSEEEWVELQMEGTIRIITKKEEQEHAWNIFLEKFPQSAKRKPDPKYALLSFVPSWWRYTEFRPKPPQIISSEST